jgi:hypothetical protein
MKDFQIFRKEIQARGNKNPNPAEGNPKKNLGFPSPKRALSKGYGDPSGPSSFVGRFRPQRRDRSVGGACSLRAVCRSFCLHFGSSSFMKRVKGWRHFDRGRLDAIAPTCRPRA